MDRFYIHKQFSIQMLGAENKIFSYRKLTLRRRTASLLQQHPNNFIVPNGFVKTVVKNVPESLSNVLRRSYSTWCMILQF